MSDLREALEALVADREGIKSNYPNDYVIAPYELRELLAAHPVEPAARCTKTTYGGIYGVVPCAEVLVNGECPQNQQHFIDDAPAPAQVEITDEATGEIKVSHPASRAARDAWHARWCGEDRECTPGDHCAGAPDMAALKAALAAALPYLVPRAGSGRHGETVEIDLDTIDEEKD